MKSLDEIIEEINIPKNEYLIIFNDECLEPIRMEIDKNINRPNNPSDDEIIKEYISFNYGSTEYRFYKMSDIEYIRKI